MLLINKQENDPEFIMSLEGRLDTLTASQFEAELRKVIKNVNVLVLDMEKLTYVSSAGLRVLLKAQQVMEKQGSMVIRNANQEIRDVFELTNFDDILTIE